MQPLRTCAVDTNDAHLAGRALRSLIAATRVASDRQTLDQSSGVPCRHLRFLVGALGRVQHIQLRFIEAHRAAGDRTSRRVHGDRWDSNLRHVLISLGLFALLNRKGVPDISTHA